MADRKTSRATGRKPDYWCHPQKDGHPTLYFHGHELITRAEYVGAVDPDDCDPHIRTGKRAKGTVRKTGPRTEREQMKRMQMPGKRVNIDDETWTVLDLLARD